MDSGVGALVFFLHFHIHLHVPGKRRWNSRKTYVDALIAHTKAIFTGRRKRLTYSAVL